MMKLLYSFLIVFICLTSVFSQSFKTSWPMMGGDPAQTSNALIDISFPVEIVDIFNVGFNSCDGIVFSDEKLFLTNDSQDNSIMAIDPETGQVLWSFVIATSAGSVGFVPAVSEGIVLAGSQSAKGLYGLDAETGDSLWILPVGSLYTRLPAIYDGLIYQVSPDSLYCLDLHTGQPLWSHTGNMPQISPVVDSLYVYFGSDNQLRALDRLTGTELWSNPNIWTAGFSCYALDDERVYIGFRDKVSAVDKSTGNLLWQVVLDSNEVVIDYPTAFALTDSLVVVKIISDDDSQNRYRVLHRESGAELSAFKGGVMRYGAPTVINNYLADAADGQIMFLDLLTGDTVQLIGGLPFFGFPVQIIASNDRIYVAADGPNIFVLGNKPSATDRFLSAIEMEVFPNPTTDQAVIQFDMTMDADLNVSLINAMGMVIQNLDHGFFGVGRQQIDLDLNRIPKGIYLIQIIAGNKMGIKKLMVQ